MGKVGEFFAGAALFAGGVLVTGASFGLASPLGGAMMATGLSIAGNALGAIIAGRPGNKQAQQANFNPEATAKVVYGRASVGASLGADIWVDDDDISDRESLWTFAGFCLGSEDGSGVEDVEKIWLDDILAIDPVSTGTTTNITTNVTSFYSGSDLLTYSVRRGTHSQGVNTDAQAAASNASDRYPNSFRGRGICYLAGNFWKDKEKFPNFPRSIRALIKGNRVYDPRNPSDGPNSDGWIWDSADTTASLNQNPGQNPALILLDYLTSAKYGAEAFYPERDGGDTSLSEVDEQSFISAANYCDELVRDGDGGTHPRYTFNGWIDTGNSIPENINAIKSAMRAELVMQGDKFRLVLPQVQSSVMTLTEDDIIGDWKIRRGGSRSVPNRVVAQIPTNQGENSTEVQFPDVDDSTFLDQDGGVPQVRTIKLYGVDDPYRARQISMVTLKENREDTEVQFVATERAAELEVGDIFTLDHAFPGWQGTSSKDFRVTKLEIRMDFRIRVTAKEYAESAYNLADLSTRATPPPGSNLPDPTNTPAPSSLSLTSDSTTQQVTPAGDKVARILATWDLPTNEGIDRAVVVERENGTSEWNTAAVVDPTDDQRAIFEPEGGEDGDTWEVGVYVIVGQRQRKSSITTATVTLSTDFVASDILNTIIAEDTEESDFDADGVVEGRLTIEVIADSGSYDIDFYERQGRGAFPGTASSSATGLTTGQTASHDVDLVEGKLGHIRYDVFEGGTSNLLGRNVVSFDPDDIANVIDLSVDVDPDTGALSADAAGDSDTATIYLTHTTDGTDPTDPTSANQDETISARSGSVTFSGVTVPKGEEAVVKARGENSDGQIAPVGTIKQDRQKRQTPVSTVNLLGEDAGPTQEASYSSSTGFHYQYIRGFPLSALGVSVGDDLSVGMGLRQVSGDAGMWVEIFVQFFDSSGSQVGTTQTSTRVGDGSSGDSGWRREVIEAVTIPANAATISVSVNKDNNSTGEVASRRAILNVGPISAPYSDPPDRSSNNLLGFDAWAEHTEEDYTYLGFESGTNGMPLGNLGLTPGDIVSVRAQAANDGTSREYGIFVQFLDSGGSEVGRIFETKVSSSSGAYFDVAAHGRVIPDNTAFVHVRGGQQGSGSTSVTKLRRAMLNRGSRAAPFSGPDIKWDRDDFDIPDTVKDRLKFLGEFMPRAPGDAITMGDVAFSGGQVKVQHTGDEYELYSYDPDTGSQTGVCVGARLQGTGTGGSAGDFTLRVGPEDITVTGGENCGLDGSTDYHVGWDRENSTLITSKSRQDALGKDIAFLGTHTSANEQISGDGTPGDDQTGGGTLK